MADHDDMRHRAAQQASYGNYWAGKCVGLLDRIKKLEAENERLVEAALNECVKAQGWQPETRPTNFTKLNEGRYDDSE